MVRRWLSPRALLLHLMFLVVASGCLLAGWWQVHRALSGNLLSYAYSAEWPAFAVIAGIAWWQLIHDQRWDARAGSSAPSERLAGSAGASASPGVGPDPPVGTGKAAAPGETRPRRSWEPEPGTPEWEAFQADLAADLADRVPKTWGGRRPDPARDERR